MSLHIIATGGTFDKRYDELSKSFNFSDSHLSNAIARSRMTLPVTSQQLLLPDSPNIGEGDRDRVLEACHAANQRAVVIIHPTDAIAETAAVLHRAGLSQTIVFTSSMVPYEVDESDALFNLGFACGVAQVLPAGIYMALSGVVTPLTREVTAN
jgi:L-asparaginase